MPNTLDRVTRGSPSGISNGSPAERDDSIKGEVLHKPLQKFFKTINGTPLNVTKAVWGLTPIIQTIGLVNESAGKLARAFYGACWSIAYTCSRPWATDRHELPEDGGAEKVTNGWKTIYNANEHFRVGMGSLVSAVYGGGAFGMLWSWFKGDDDLYDKAANVYQIGMLNQNQIFASMNYTEVLRRRFIDKDHLKEADESKTNAKAKIELIDSFMFIPNIITRGLDTFRIFGTEFGETTQKIINVFSYAGYGTWAARFGLLKQTEEKTEIESKQTKCGNGLLDKVNPNLKGNALKADEFFHDMQKYGGRAFYTLLPGLSWLAAGTELFGFKEIAEKAFKFEGILERLNPAIGAWCVRNVWLKLFEKKQTSQEQVQEVQPVQEQASPVQQEIPPAQQKIPPPVLDKRTESLLFVMDVLNGRKELSENSSWEELFEIVKEHSVWEKVVEASEKGLIPLVALIDAMNLFPDTSDEGHWAKALEGAHLASLSHAVIEKKKEVISSEEEKPQIDKQSSIFNNREPDYGDYFQRVSYGLIPKEILIDEVREGLIPFSVLQRYSSYLTDELGKPDDEFFDQLTMESNDVPCGV